MISEDLQVEHPDWAFLGGQLRTARLERGWSQTELAAQTGAHQPFISGVEQGKRRASDEFIKLVSTKLLLDPERVRRVRDIAETDLSMLIPGTGIREYLKGKKDQLFLRDPAAEMSKTFNSVYFWVSSKMEIESDSNSRKERLDRIQTQLKTLPTQQLQRVEDFMAGLKSAMDSF